MPAAPSNWSTASPAQKRRFNRLRDQTPQVNLKHLECPDCGKRLVLKTSIYGRFYGCETWKKTGCRGAVSAQDDGTPRGIPVPSEVRKKRKAVLTALEAWASHSALGVAPCDVLAAFAETVGRDPQTFKIGVMDGDECDKLMAHLETLGAPKSVWTMLSEDDFEIEDPIWAEDSDDM